MYLKENVHVVFVSMLGTGKVGNVCPVYRYVINTQNHA